MYLHNPTEAARQEYELASDWFNHVLTTYDWKNTGVFIAASERRRLALEMYVNAQKRYG